MRSSLTQSLSKDRPRTHTYISFWGKISVASPISAVGREYLRVISVDTRVMYMPGISIKARCREPLLATQRRAISCRLSHSRTNCPFETLRWTQCFFLRYSNISGMTQEGCGKFIAYWRLPESWSYQCQSLRGK